MSDRILDLAKKLQELADRGVGGEKENAESQLKRLIEKYNLNFEDLQEIKPVYRIFKFNESDLLEKKFVRQIIANVAGEVDMYYDALIHNSWAVEISDLQYIEISEKIAFYWPIFQKEQEIFYTAFVQKNNLTLNSDRMPNFSPEEMEKLRKAHKMMGSMERHTFKKLLSNGENT